MNGFQKTIKIFAIFLAIIIILSMIRAALFGLSLVTNINFNSNNGKEFSEVYRDVEKIDIQTSAANIMIKAGEELKVVAYNVKNSFSSKIDKGILKISDKKRWFTNNNDAVKIILYIPQDVNFDELKINSGAGKIEIDNISMNNFDIDQGAGLLKISNSKFNNINIDGGVGATFISSSILNNLYLEAGVGSIDIESEITGNSEIECGIGQINLLLNGDESLYSITTKKGIGSIKINNEGQSDNQIYGNGNNKIKVNGGIGNISIKFGN